MGLLEREYFRAAREWFRCRFQIMTWCPFRDLMNAQLGEHDWEQEMKRIINEIKSTL